MANKGLNTATGNDTITLMGIPLNNFGTGKILEITWDNTLITQKVGKNGNSVTVFTPAGNQAKAVLKVMRASSDDTYIDSLLKLMRNDITSFVPLALTLKKPFGLSTGYQIGGSSLTPPSINLSNDSTILTNGFFSKNPMVMTDIDGDIEQTYTVCEMLFSNFERIFD